MTISIVVDNEKVAVSVTERRGAQTFFYARDSDGSLEELRSFYAQGFVPTLSDESVARAKARTALWCSDYTVVHAL
jgi:hypothetical protein